jgi:hypothetical protein
MPIVGADKHFKRTNQNHELTTPVDSNVPTLMIPIMEKRWVTWSDIVIPG